jgi:hypothetical protein
MKMGKFGRLFVDQPTCCRQIRGMPKRTEDGGLRLGHSQFHHRDHSSLARARTLSMPC